MKTVKDVDGNDVNVEEYRKGLNDWPTSRIPYMDEDGKTSLANCCYKTHPCGCKITGCGTLQFPLAIEFCEKHSIPDPIPNPITDEIRFTLLVTAIEGGSNYWYFIADTTEIDLVRTKTLHNEDLDTFVGKMWNAILNGATIVIQDRESGEKAGEINYFTILKGEELMLKKHTSHFGDILTDNMDAETADIWFQLAAMGEVIYG